MRPRIRVQLRPRHTKHEPEPAEKTTREPSILVSWVTLVSSVGAVCAVHSQAVVSCCWCDGTFRFLCFGCAPCRSTTAMGQLSMSCFDHLCSRQRSDFCVVLCICQTGHGHHQATAAGLKIKSVMEASGEDYNLFFYTSPYKRSLQTYDGIRCAATSHAHPLVHLLWTSQTPVKLSAR